jgi:hypothetical protein
MAARRRPVPPPDDAADAAPPPARLMLLAGGVLAALVIAMLAAPSTDGAAPQFSPSLWIVPAIGMLGALVLLSRTLPRAPELWTLAAVATLSCAFMIDRYMPDVGPHWSQKHVIASYFAHRDSPSEPLIVWDLYWRGENLYTRNIIFDQPNPSDRWAWTTPRDNATQFFARYKGRIFFEVERGKLESLKGFLPPEGRNNVKIIDESNNKLYLVETRL